MPGYFYFSSLCEIIFTYVDGEAGVINFYLPIAARPLAARMFIEACFGFQVRDERTASSYLATRWIHDDSLTQRR